MAAGHFSGAEPLLLVLPALAMLLISGCTTGGTLSGKGVAVKEFAPEFTEIYSGEPVTFRLLMKNEGSVDAKDMHAELLGLDEDWCGESSTTTLTKCERSTGQRLERLPNEPECSYKSGLGGGFSLLAPDPQRGTSGSSHICTWTYKAPPIQKGFSITYTPTARVFYTYKSGVVKLITFGSSRELRTIQDTGGKLPAETKSQTSSPIMLDIQTQGPIRFWQGENKIVFPLEVTITNVGGGVACADQGYVGDTLRDACKGDESKKNKVKIRISFGANKNNMKLSQGCLDLAGEKTISLWKGQSNSIVCEVEASNLDPEATIQIPVTVEAVYEYYVDTPTSIKVIGRTESGGFSDTGFPSSGGMW